MESDNLQKILNQAASKWEQQPKESIQILLDSIRSDPTEPRLFEQLIVYFRALGMVQQANALESQLVQMTAPLSSSSSKSFKVSAIVSIYKASRFLKHKMQDLLQQTLGEQLEIIVINANSPEDEDNIMQEFLHLPQVVYYKCHEREGLYASWARGTQMARGDYITNSNVDDFLRHDALEKLAQALDKHPEAGLAYGDFWVTNRDNQTFTEHIRTGFGCRPDYTPRLMLWGCYMGPQPMWRKSLHAQIGSFDPSYQAAGDYEFWCRIAAAGHSMIHLKEFLGIYQHNPTGIINSNMDTSAQETQAVRQKYQHLLPAPDPQPVFDHYRWDHQVPTSTHAEILIHAGTDSEPLANTIEQVRTHTFYPYRLTILSSSAQITLFQNWQTEARIHQVLDLPANLEALRQKIHVSQPQATYFIILDAQSKPVHSQWVEMLVGILEQNPSIQSISLGDYQNEQQPVFLTTNPPDLNPTIGICYRMQEIQNNPIHAVMNPQNLIERSL